MEDKEKELPNFQTDYQKCSWYSDIFYTWATDFIMHIYNRKTLERVDQCIQMAEKDSSNSLCDRLTNNLNDMNKDGKFAYRWGIIYLVIKTLKWDVFSTLLYGFLAEFLQVTNLFVISFYIRWIQDDDREKWLGFFLSFFIAIVAFVSLVIRHKFFFFAGVTGLNMRKSITALIFKKILRFNQKSLAKASTGKIVTIVSGELQMVEQGLIMAPYIVIAPFATIYAFSLIAIDFGEAAAIGFAMFIIIIICQALISRATVRWKYWEGVYSDRRMKVIGDIVNGIRTIKCYAWEKPFDKLVYKWRKSQLAMLLKNHTINAVGSGIFLNGGFVIGLVMFSYHWGMDREFSYERSLSAIALLSYLSLTAIFFSYNAISNFATFVAIMFRVGEILKMDEYDYDGAKNDTSLPEGVRVKLQDASFTWGFHIHKTDKKDEIEEDDEQHEDINLRSLNLEASDGQLICVVGTVGCGKSSLLHSLMNELKLKDGHISTNGTKAYVEQEPFIMSGTVKENILMGDTYDPDKFDQVVQACCLDHDIANFESGIDTEIGERGITISGGQKARLSLARAVYSDADIYLLDDPLSAVDPDVAVKIFKKCINGYLKDKCRFLVTHQVQHLKKEKHICVIEDNTIKYSGSYEELKEQGIDFDSILKTYEQKDPKEDKDSDEIDVDEVMGDEEDPERHNSDEEEKDDNAENRFHLPSIHPTDPNALDTENINEGTEKKESNQISDLDETKKHLSANETKGTDKKGVIQKEVKIKGNIKIKEFFNFARYGIGICGVIMSILLSLLCACFFVSVGFTVGEWTSEDAGSDRSMWYYLFMGSVALYVIVSFLRCLIVAAVCVSSSQKLHSKMVWKLLRAKITLFDSTPIGTIMTRFSKDLAITDFLLPQMTNFALITLSKVTVLIVFIVIVIPWNLIILLLVLIPMLMIRRYSILAQNDSQRHDAMSKGPINTRYSSAIDGITSIRAYNRRDFFIDGFMKDCDLNAGARFCWSVVMRWSGTRTDICSCIFVAGNLLLITILVAFFDVFDKKLAALTVQFSLEFSFTANVAIRFYGEVENMLTSAQRMMEYANMNSEDELNKPNDPKDFPAASDVFFSNVHMRYQPHLPKVLKGLTYQVKQSQKVGIIGRTGAGKSSIVQTIFRLVETEPGSQIIIGGEDIKDIGLHCLRNAISFIPQSPFLISSTIRANLDPFEVYSDEQVWEVLEEVQLKDYISSLKDGLATEVTDQNIFSVGQKQLICLARAILRNTKILVLDEATANVDIETDSLIQRSIREKFRDCTVLTIAHRIATISDSDQILVMEDGRVKKHGKPDEILPKLSRRESA